jgi:hypothetical protein
VTVDHLIENTGRCNSADHPTAVASDEECMANHGELIRGNVGLLWWRLLAEALVRNHVRFDNPSAQDWTARCRPRSVGELKMPSLSDSKTPFDRLARALSTDCPY